MPSKRYRAHLTIVKNDHVYVSRTGKVPNIYDVISDIVTSSPWRSLFAWRVTSIFWLEPITFDSAVWPCINLSIEIIVEDDLKFMYL